MQVQPGDRVKAVILVVAIVGVMAFVLKTALFRGQAAPAPSPNPAPAPVAANTPPQAATSTPTNSTTVSPAAPEVSVDLGAKAVEGPKGANPFRKTVAEKGSTGNTSADWADRKLGTKPPKPIEGEVRPLPAPDRFVAEAEFRLAGVMIDSPSVAIVTRGGSKTQFLHVGNKAAYGYTISAIRPNGIKVVQKKEARWVRVGEVLQPPDSVAPPPATAPSAGN